MTLEKCYVWAKDNRISCTYTMLYDMCIHIYIYICIHMQTSSIYMCVYIYIYIYEQDDIPRELSCVQTDARSYDLTTVPVHMAHFQLGSFLSGLVSNWARFYLQSFLIICRI